MAFPQPADHEQTHALRDRGVHGRRVGELVVDVREVLGGETDALVVDLDHHAAVGQTRGVDPHLGLRGGERGGVLQQLGEQVHEVGHGLAVDLGLGDAGELDALVLLHLGGGGAEHVHEGHGLVPAAARLLTREDEEVLAVAAHTGGQVVQAEEVLQLVRVGLVVLQVGDEGQLALDQRLVAHGEVREDRVDVPSQERLLGGEPDRFPVDLVERAGDLADLVLGVDRDRVDTGVDLARVGARELVDERRQALLGDVEGGGPQAAHRTAHLAGHHAGQDEGGEQGHDHDGAVGDGVGAGVVGDRDGVVDGLLEEFLLDLVVAVELRGGGVLPGGRRRAALDDLLLGLAAGDRLGHAGEDRLVDRRDRRGLEGGAGLLGGALGLGELGGALFGLLAHDRLQTGHVLLGTRRDVLADGDFLEVGVGGEGDELGLAGVLVRARAHQEVRADGALQRVRRLGELDRVDHAAVRGHVAGAETELVGELHEVVLDRDVALFGRDGTEGGRRVLLGALDPGLVRGLADVRQLGLLRAEELQTPLHALVLGHVLDDLVELLLRGGGRRVGLVDLLVLGQAVQERFGREVTLVEQCLAVFRGRLNDPGYLLGVLGLVPRVDGALHLEAAHDQAHEGRYEKDRVQAGRHAPVAGREPAGAPTLHRRFHGHVGGRRGRSRRRGEVAARGFIRGACVASPHSTNNLSAVLLASSLNSSTVDGPVPNS